MVPELELLTGTLFNDSNGVVEPCCPQVIVIGESDIVPSVFAHFKLMMRHFPSGAISGGITTTPIAEPMEISYLLNGMVLIEPSFQYTTSPTETIEGLGL